MEGGQSWLAEVLPELRAALDQRNMYDLPDDIYFTLAGFTDASRVLIGHASAVEAALSVSALRVDLGGTEDGYVAIRDALRRPSDRGRHDGHAERHRLEDHVRQTLGHGVQHQ